MLLKLSLPLVEIFALFVPHLFSVSFLPFLFPFVASLYHSVFELLSFFLFLLICKVLRILSLLLDF